METNFGKNKKNAPVGRKGFSLMEMIVAIFIFSLVMTTVTSIFVQAFNARKKAKEIQVNIENARYAMELMAKSLRMSSVVDDSVSSSILIYDYSQKKCIRYYYDSTAKKIMSQSSTAGITYDNCVSSPSLGSAQELTSGIVSGFYRYITPSDNNDPKQIGRVTIAIAVCEDENCVKKNTIQTTVSLRDYGYIVSQ